MAGELAQIGTPETEEEKRKRAIAGTTHTLPAKSDPLATRNTDGTPAVQREFDKDGRVIQSQQNVHTVRNPTGSAMTATNTDRDAKSVFDPQGGVHDTELYDYNSAPEVDSTEIERLRMNATMGQDGPEMMGYQKAIASQLLDNDASGPSNEREALIHARDYEAGKPYVRAVDPTAYAQSDLQKQAGSNIGALADYYNAGRDAPTAERAVLDSSLGGGASADASLQQRTVVGDMAGYNAAKIKDVGPVGVAKIDPVTGVVKTDLGSASLASAAQIDKSPQDQLRDIQVTQANRLSNTASGQGPSLVNSQLQKGMEQSLATQVAGAQAQRGNSKVGGTQKNLANAGALAQANASGKAAELGIAERQGAESQLTSSLTSTRAQDLGLATNQAGLEQQTNLSNQGAVNQRTSEQGQLNQQANVIDAGASNQRATNQANLEQGALSQTSSQRASLAQRQAELDTQAVSDYTAAKNSGTLTQAQLDASRNAADQGAQNALNNILVDRDSQMKIAQLDADSRINLADLDSKLKVMGYDDNMRAELLAQEVNFANQQVAQGISYDSAAVARSIARDNAGRNKSNDAAARNQQYTNQAVGALSGIASVA